MEKGTGDNPPPAAAPLAYRAPPGGAVGVGRLAATVLLGLFWFGLALCGAATLVVVSLITLSGDRPAPKRVEAVALWLVTVVCLGPTSAAAFALAVRYVALDPVRMVRAARHDDSRAL